MSKILIWIRELIAEYKRAWSEDCPHCGYYCHGKSVYCAKYPINSGEKK